MNSTDSRLTTITWTLNISLNLTKTKIKSDLCTILSSHLSSIRSVLLRTTETHLTSRRPRNDLTLIVSKRYNNVIE